MLTVIICLNLCRKFCTKHERGLTIVAVAWLDPLLSLLLHGVRGRVVNVGLAFPKQLLTQTLDSGEVVTCVGKLIWLNLQHGNILQDHLQEKKTKNCILPWKLHNSPKSHPLKKKKKKGQKEKKFSCWNRNCGEERNATYLLKVLLLLLRVCVIKAHDQLALEVNLVVLVEKGGLGMANVQVPADISVLLRNFRSTTRMWSHWEAWLSSFKPLCPTQALVQHTHWPLGGIAQQLCPFQHQAAPQTSQHPASSPSHQTETEMTLNRHIGCM